MADEADRAGPEQRVSDADRREVVEHLRAHTTDGPLALDEFTDRVTGAYAARTRGELERITADLPALAGPAVVGARRRATRWTVAVLGDASRKGRWRVEGAAVGVAVMGDCTIDLGAAEFRGQEIVVTAVSVMGDVTVLVPEGLDVELGGVALMGAKNDQVRPVPVVAGRPWSGCGAVAVMGEVTVGAWRPAVPEPAPSLTPLERALLGS